MSAGFPVHDQAVCTGVYKSRQVPLRLDDHQVYVQRHAHQRAQRPHHARPKGDVGHKAPVHHVYLNGVNASGFGLAGLLAQACIIRRQDRGLNHDHCVLLPSIILRWSLS